MLEGWKTPPSDHAKHLHFEYAEACNPEAPVQNTDYLTFFPTSSHLSPYLRVLPKWTLVHSLATQQNQFTDIRLLWRKVQLLLQVPNKEHGRLVLKRPKLSTDAFQRRVFKGNFWGEGCRMHSFLLMGGWWGNVWCSRNLVLCMKSPSSTWVGGLSSYRTIQDMYQIVMNISWGGTRTLFYCCLLSLLFLLNCFSFVFALPHFSS